MRDAVIVEAVRTPIGKRNGALAGWHPADLSGHVLRALADRAGIDPAVVDDVVWGCVSQVGEQANNIGRYAVLNAGWPESVPGCTVDRQCGSSQQALHWAAAGVVSGQYDVAVAGGVESMTRVPIGSPNVDGRYGIGMGGDAVARRYDGVVFNQGIGAELIAERWGLSRRALDEFSLGSHAAAAAAIDAGAFAEHIVPVPVAMSSDGGHSGGGHGGGGGGGGDGAGGGGGGHGEVVPFSVDQGVRRGGTLDRLAELKPVFVPEGRIHAGNSSQISDGCAALLVTTSEIARELGLRPVVRVHTAVLAGDDPVAMLTAPIPATAKALARSGLSIDEIGVFEVNEAFASVPLAWLAETGVDPKKLNPLGGAIALGHPLGASGAQIMTKMIYHMRDNGIRYGLQTMCEGGGTANATILELVTPGSA
jgi:acetyl-CoA acyltransferase